MLLKVTYVLKLDKIKYRRRNSYMKIQIYNSGGKQLRWYLGHIDK